MTTGSDNGRYLLLPHPHSEPGAAQDLVQELAVTVTRKDGLLLLGYRLTGDIPALRLPDPRSPVRSDGLWRHSCFEAFIGPAGATEYWEYNFSPSGAWAAYHFSAYREGMAPLMKGAPPVISCHAGDATLEMDVAVDLSWLARSTAGIGLRLGLSAVVEDRARGYTYWALKHPTEKPDFHHADGFAVELD